MNTAEVLKKYELMKSTAPGSKHRDVARDFKRVLVTNPQIVSDIAFDDTIPEETREDILFIWSKDHTGSCRITDNPRWADMMRSYIIPKFDALPEDFRHLIKWYQSVHGL